MQLRTWTDNTVQLQEQLLDAKDRIGELEEINERHQDEIAALKADIASRPTSADGVGSTDTAIEALRKRNEELEKVTRSTLALLDLADKPG